MSALVETIAYAGEVPWHGLGTKVPHDISTNEMSVSYTHLTLPTITEV